MTNEEKAVVLDYIAEDVCAGSVWVLRQAAAHFRELIPNAEGLLPCPMCGPHGKPTTNGTFQNSFIVVCLTCCLRTIDHMEKADAIAAWNRRGGVDYEP